MKQTGNRRHPRRLKNQLRRSRRHNSAFLASHFFPDFFFAVCVALVQRALVAAAKRARMAGLNRRWALRFAGAFRLGAGGESKTGDAAWAGVSTAGAEIAAAGLMGNKRAQVVGERTYGDASVRRALTMEDGSAIILSVAKYYSPDGKAIQDTGVTPGVLVSEPEPQVDVDENGEPIPAPPPEATPGKPVPGPPEVAPQKKAQDDPVVKKALEVLAAKA